MTHEDAPLGRKTPYPASYDPGLLYPIPRADGRNAYLEGDLPFDGVDVWNAWDLTWLGPGRVPVAATARLVFPASSANIVESKSLKLYLNSFSMSVFDNERSVADTIGRDVSNAAGADVGVTVVIVGSSADAGVTVLPGNCIDSLATAIEPTAVNADVLRFEQNETTEEDLHSHLLRSLCPVTGQPDIGSVAIHYRGPKVDRTSLLTYLVSFREHNDFHEACIERMYVDLLRLGQPDRLSVLGCYQRRGGIDINPYRSNFDCEPAPFRLWRQ